MNLLHLTPNLSNLPLILQLNLPNIGLFYFLLLFLGQFFEELPLALKLVEGLLVTTILLGVEVEGLLEGWGWEGGVGRLVVGGAVLRVD